jgi:hypothetical protein
MSGVDWVLLAKGDVRPGDLVSAEAGGMPIYRVLAVDDGLAWLQGATAEVVRVMPLDRFCWRAAGAAAGQPPTELLRAAE